ncbi:MAG: PAS domain S-box protein [Deltaproteobacteria bacterium]|nr:PAS domain S-box protein [Deltaproteobacteria bacterium]
MENEGSVHIKTKLPVKNILFETMFEVAQIGIVITDTNPDIQYINPEFTKIFGYTKEEALGKSVADLIIKDASDSKIVSPEMISGESVEYETVRWHKNGKKIDVFCRVSPIIINNLIVGGFTFYSDITKRKEAQESLQKANQELEERVEQRARALLKSEKKYHALFDQSIDAIIIHEKGRIKDVNNRACEMLGYSKEQLLEMTILDLHREADKEIIEKNIQSVLHSETQLVKANGELIDVEIRPNIIDLETSYTQAVIRDITERKQAENKLKESEEKYRTTIESSYDGVAIIQDAVHIYVNSSYARIYGYGSPEEVVGKADITLIHPDDMETIKKRGQSRLKGEIAGAERYEHKGIKKNGEVIYVEVSVAKIMHNGKPATLIFARDVTDRKETEKKLEKAMRDSELANKSKSEFLANMSHEIRTPLNGVMGILNLLLSTNLDSEQLDLIETGVRSSESLLTVINDILDFSKIEAGELDLETINFNLRNAVAEVVELPAMMAQKKGVEFSYEIHHETPNLLRGDPGRLRQIILNLTNNAIKFTDKGEVNLRVFVTEEQGSHVELMFEVKDTGVGIPDDKRDIIFESFKQSDSSTTRKYGGTGLGLSISKKLAHLMNGDIGVISSEGKGSTFWFTAVLEKQDNAVEKAPLPLSGIRGRRFLIVDENRTNLRILTGYLESWGCACDTIESGEEALKLMYMAEKEKALYDAVILDMRMRGIKGDELGKMIKDDPVLKGTPLIMLTAQGIKGDASRMEKIGFAAYLTKPIRRSLLYDCLVEALSKGPKIEKDKKSPIVTKHSVYDERRNKIKILIVEDNLVNQKIIQKIMAKAGFGCSIASNGKEAIKALENDNYDIVLMDIQMPEMDGIEATRIIRNPASNVRNHDIPIIAMTAHAMKGDREICIAAGMNDYASKPIQPQELFNKLEKQISLNTKSTE